MMRFNRMLIPLNISFFCTVCFFKSKSFTRNQAVKYATFSANLKKIRTVSYWNLNGAFSGRLCYLFLINTLLRDGFRGGHGGRALLFFAITCFFCDHFEELQTVLIQVKLIVNNAPLTYVYPNTIEAYLTPNHLLFGRQLLCYSNTTSTVDRNLTVLSSTTDKINHISNHFWHRWRHEYAVNLRETQQASKLNMNSQKIML